ncbi:type I 3-dehydroquinate dehydratase [Bacteroidota bacterium]
MICVSLSNLGFKECLALAEQEDFVEFRFDLLDFSTEEVHQVVSISKRSVATYRPHAKDPDRRMQTMITAIKAGANYVDIELEAESYFRKELIKTAKTHGRDVIISYHNFDHTPDASRLKKIVESCKKSNADVVKIACQVNNEEDIRALMGLYLENDRMVVIGMGKKGLITRVAAPFLGAEFTFASPGKGQETAPGQIDKKELTNLIDQIQFPFVREQYNKNKKDE